jgi:TetR/AcrR family transcriptional repressor of mexJK operon
MRVRTAARREAILDTAARVFMEFGYERASLAEIAARADCSKVTLYGYFASKEDLFMGVLLHLMGADIDPALKDLSAHAAEDPRRLLTLFGERYLNAALSAEGIAFKRLIVAHIPGMHIEEQFWTLGPQRFLDSLDAYLAGAVEAGRLRVENREVAAQQLIALYEAETRGGGLFSKQRSFTREQIRRMVARAVDTFLLIYGCAGARVEKVEPGKPDGQGGRTAQTAQGGKTGHMGREGHAAR